MSSSRPSSSAGRTRRPLPASVYWRRRVFVLGLAFSLVFVIARLLSAGSDGSSDDAPLAEQAAARVRATETVTAGEDLATTGSTGSATATGRGTAPATASTKPTLAAPDGPCAPEDVVVTPSVVEPAEGGGDVTITLSLQTASAEACTWHVDRSSVAVKISEGTTELWTTRECPRAIRPESVVVRRAVATEVALTWNARESSKECSRRAEWVLPGDYTVSAAALGGEPTSAEFTLRSPAPRTVEVTPKSAKKPGAGATKKAKRD